MTTTNMLAAALRYAGHGWAVFPLFTPTDGVCDCPKRTACTSPGKHPRTMRGHLDATIDVGYIRRWWGAQWPDANIGLATQGLVVVDVDVRNNGDASLAELDDRHGPLPETLEARTGNGWHLYYSGDRACGDLATGIQVKARGGFVVAPPSLHHSGARYSWRNRCPVAPAPAWLLAGASGRGPALAISDTIPHGDRNLTLFRLACAMRRPGASERAILAALRVENSDRCRPPLDDDELVQIARSAARYEPRQPTEAA